MTLTILGCNGPYPAQGGACSSYLLTSASGKTSVVIDFGTGALANLPRFSDYAAPDAFILTHLHYDHMSDMLPLIYVLQFHPRDEKLPVYAPESELLRAPCFDLRPPVDMQIGEFSVRFLPVRHPVETYAVRIEADGKSFVFTGDTNECPQLTDFCRGADLLLADAGLSEADWSYEKPHLSALRCGMLARACGARQLILTHFNPKYDVDDLLIEALAVFPETQAASVGRRYEI